MGRGDEQLKALVARQTEKPWKYVLDAGEPVPVREHDRWRDWINTNDRRRIVARTDLADDLYVETWFTGVDHRLPTDPPGPPLPFLTEVYRGGQRVECYRSSRERQAGNTHTAVASRLVAALEP